MKVIFFLKLLLLFIFLQGCIPGKKATVSPSAISDSSQVKEEELQIYLQATNLSEDMSSLSTHNDEILLLMYAKGPDSIPLAQPWYSKYLVFDSLNKSYLLNEPLSGMLPDSSILYLLEIDTEQTIQALDSIVRQAHIQLTDLYQKYDLAGITRLLGDDDLLRAYLSSETSLIVRKQSLK